MLFQGKKIVSHKSSAAVLTPENRAYIDHKVFLLCKLSETDFSYID